MTFDELMNDGLAAAHDGHFSAAAELFARAGEAARNEAEAELAAIRRAGIDVVCKRPEPDLRVFRHNVVRRHSTLHVWLAAYYLTAALVDRGDREGAARYLSVLLDASREVDDPVRMVMAYDTAAGVESIRGNHIAAIEYGRSALQTLERANDPYLRATVTHNLAYNCLAASDYAEAVRYAEQAVALAEVVEDDWVLAEALVTAAFAYLCRDRYAEALAALDRCEPRGTGTRLEKYVHYIRGEIARRQGDRDEAARQFKKLEALYPGIPTLTEMLLSMNLTPFLLPE